MKTKIYFFAITVMSAFGLQAQTIMNIHQNNGTVLQIPLNTIDSITYTMPNPGNIVTNPGAGVTFDGYTYSSILLGNGQEWMAENLRTSSYANGDPIPNVTDSLQWLNTTSGAWAHYDNDSLFENPYGKLYNFYTVIDFRGLCPSGWQVPSEIDWLTLVNYLGGTSLAGGAIKDTSTNYWFAPNTGATNLIGFNAVGSGIKIFNGVGGDQWGCQFKNDYGHMWSSTPSVNCTQGMAIYPKYDNSNGPIGGTEKNNGIAVRCLKD